MSLAENGFLSGFLRASLLRFGFIDRRRTDAFAQRIIDGFDVRTTGPAAQARSLSGGNLQKFLVGREVMQDPAVLVINQPTWGVDAGKQGRNDKVLRACVITVLLGLTFLALKGYEWHDDFDKHLVPGPGFGIPGPDQGGAQIFYVIYYVATVLHALHMAVGIGLVGWIGWNARRPAYSPEWHTPVQVVGLYWSFVDIVWLTFYPLIYVVGRT